MPFWAISQKLLERYFFPVTIDLSTDTTIVWAVLGRYESPLTSRFKYQIDESQLTVAFFILLSLEF